jgi:chorismate synthase
LAHDEIAYAPPSSPRPDGGFTRSSNGAGGLEGGMTNGAPLLLRCALKPISTLRDPLASVNLASGRPEKASYERSDVCAVPAAGVVGENLAAFVLAQACLEKFGGDSLEELLRNYRGYLAQISRPRGG